MLFGISSKIVKKNCVHIPFSSKLETVSSDPEGMDYVLKKIHIWY